MLIHGIHLNPDGDMVIRHQKQTGKPFEAESIAAWHAACTHGTALDIGAYTGLYALVAAKAGADAYAFEPNFAVYERLQQNIEANQLPVASYLIALSDREGHASMALSKTTRLTSGGKITEGTDTVLATVDGFDFGNVTAIKIDAEGHECAVLRGALATIRRFSPLIITEALTDEALQDQAAILKPLGYVPAPADEWNVIWSR